MTPERARKGGSDVRWVFAYGSLIWRPSFPFVSRATASIDGWKRRLWQGSTDHRGTPGAPGRVVTLVRERAARCLGVVYELPIAEREAILAHLDHREKGGYERHVVRARCHPEDRQVDALVYLAGADNPEFLGPAAFDLLVAQVRGARGPSGSNEEYVLRLADALASLGGVDEHVFEVARALRGEPA